MDITIKVKVSPNKEQNPFFRKLRFLNSANANPFLFYSTCPLIILVLLTLYVVYSSKNVIFMLDNQEHSREKAKNRSESCDLFKGRWIPDARGSFYSNYSCKTIPEWKNCFLQGRKDREFLNWRWKPDQCELPAFDPKMFLSIVQGKTMAFIGDSVGRNQMDSLLCLLSLEETPVQIYKEGDGQRSTTWKFPKHDFTLHFMWSQFLVTATERIINNSNTGNFDLQLDRIDPKWFEKLPSVSYAIISNGNWFFRQNYLYEGNNLIGCNNCGASNVTNLGPIGSIKKAFRSALKEIRKCNDCKKIHILLRTFSPQHFEGGPWNAGGRCNRTRPYTREEVVNRGDLQYRNAQVEEFDIVRNEAGENENAFEVIDVTDMMLMRADGHPGEYYGKKWMTGYNDCIHWCLPGPIDTWNEVLLEIIKRSI